MSGALRGLLAAVISSQFAIPALAATTTTPVSGALGPTQETCLQGLTTAVSDGENCMYDGGPSSVVPGAVPFGEQTGPYNQITYYDSVATPEAFQATVSGSARTLYVPEVGDGKMSQDIAGSITIDDNGDGFGANDLISFNLTLTSSGAGDIVRHYGSSIVEQYSTMTQVLAPVAANSATANGLGGFDYVIGSEGFPTRLVFAGTTGNDTGDCVGALFGEVECGHSFGAQVVDPNFWSNTSAAGLGSLESNFGAKTAGAVTGLQCIDSISATGVASNDCRDSQVGYSPYLGVAGTCLVSGGCVVGGVRGAAEDAGWDHLLLKVSTDATGRVVAVEGFNVDDYRVFGQTRCGDNTDGTGTYLATCNSWTSGYFTLAGEPAADAVDDGPVSAPEGVAVDIDILANDANFDDPVTVTITTPPTKGVAVVTGSPGNAADIRINYTADVGESGADSLVYSVTDGSETDSATVAIDVVGAFSANDDTAVTNRNQPVNISVGANDSGFDDSVTVTIDGGSFTAGGSATVTAGNGGPAAGVVVTYVPDSAAGSPGYQESFSYTIDDGVLPAATATVTVTVNNTVPVASDGAINGISTQGAAPAGRTGTFTAPGVGGSLGNTGGTAAVTVTAQGARGTATVAGATITYAVTDAAFFTGVDSFTYLVTDADGETDSGTVTVNIANVAPVIADGAIIADEDRASAAFSPAITPGNGSAAQHALAVTGQAANGTCAVSPANATGAVTYTPDPDFTGTDSCVLTLTDGDLQSDTATISVTVNPVDEVRGGVGGASSLGPWFLALLGAGLLRRRRGAGRALAAVAALGLLAGPWASAQEDDDGGIGEIVVTARKVEEKLLDVPLAITAFDAAAIEASGITNIGDLAELTPGLSFFNAFGENLPVPVIRGIAPTDIFGQNNAAIFVDGVYISGREGLNASLLDLERIEVVKGPQSALYGRTAFSGAINYVTKKPAEEFEARTTAEAGNRGKVRGFGSISGPLLGETFRGRLVAQYDEWDGSYDNAIAGGPDVGGYRTRTLYGRLLWEPNDDVEINLSYYTSTDDIDDAATVALPTNCEDRINDGNSTVRLQNFCGEVPDIEAIPGLNGGDDIPRLKQATGENRELDRLIFRVDGDAWADGTFSALTGYSRTRQSSVSDFGRSLGENQRFLYCEGAPEDPEVPNSCGANPADLEFFTGIYDPEKGSKVEELSQELRFTSDQTQRFRYTVGGYWYDERLKAYPGGPISTKPLPATAIGTAPGLPPFDPSAPNFAIGTAIFYTTFTPDGGIDPLGRVIAQDDTEGWAVFTGADFDVTDTLTARAELRLSQESQETTEFDYADCPDKTVSVPLCGDDVYDTRVLEPVESDFGSARFEQVTGRIGLDWKFNPDWMLYGSIAYGEKPGGLQLANVTVLPPASSPEERFITSTFDPEELTAYELGIKGTTWDGRMTLNAAVFFNDWQEIVLRQLRETDPVSGLPLEQPTAFNINAGDAEVLGFEAEVNVSLTDYLRGRATLGWQDSEMQSAAQDTYQQFPTFAPDGDVSGNKLLRQPEWMASASLTYERPLAGDWNWYAGGDASYQSGIYVGNDNQGYLPDHTYVNARLGASSGRYSVELWGRNIFNDNGAVAAFRDIYWANNDNLYEPYYNQGPRPNFDDFVPLRYTVSYPRETTFGLTATMRFGAAVN